jgi:predicted dehydrogenase
VIGALERGKHVYCEKPPALKAGETLDMVKAAKKAGKVLMFDLNNRVRPEVRAVMHHIKTGKVGKINAAQATRIRRNGIPGFGGWFTNKAVSFMREAILVG